MALTVAANEMKAQLVINLQSYHKREEVSTISTEMTDVGLRYELITKSKARNMVLVCCRHYKGALCVPH